MTLYDYYLDHSPTEVGRWFQKIRVTQEWAIVRQYVNRPMNIVEIGPGFGGIGSLIDLSECRYSMIETHPEITKFLKSKGFDVCRAHVPPLPIQTSSLNLVYASHVLEHMPDPCTALQFVQDIYRVLVPSGLLILVVPDYLDFGKAFWDADYTHTFPVTKRRLLQVLRDGQFDNVDLHFLYGPLKGSLGSLISFFTKFIPPNISLLSPKWQTRLERFSLSWKKNICAVAQK
jgi:SAM-dependent methyltransferase